MIISFLKMQSLGNDFIMIDSSQFMNSNIINSDFIKKISDRHFGIGCDLIVLYKIQNTSLFDKAFVDVRFFNADGSNAEFCGNAIRCIGLLMGKTKNFSSCVVKVLCHQNQKNYDVDISDKNTISFSMGKYICEHRSIDIENDLEIEKSTIAALGIYHATSINVGNPHLVLFVRNLPIEEQAKSLGKIIEMNSLFKNKINVGFAKIISDSEIDLLVFERGAGLTLSCGSGAYASICAALENEFMKRYFNHQYTVHQRGGDLQMKFLQNGSAIQTGPAAVVFSGNIEVIDTETSNDVSYKDVIVYTDGACSGNPGPGGWGAIIIKDGETIEISGRENNTTNNRMELMATICAIQQIQKNRTIELYTDSQYVKNGITKWISTWLKNGWKSSENKQVKNQDLWQNLLALSEGRVIKWNWVKGHDDNEFNNRADKLARSQCKKCD